jgi:hypothetical protein
MENLLTILKENRKIRDTTALVYKRHLNKLANAITKKDYTSNAFLRDKKKEIKSFLQNQTNSTRKNYLSSILVALSPKEKRKPEKKNKSIYDDYSNMLLNEHNKYIETLKNNEKTLKESDNWLDWKEVLKKRHKLGLEIKKMGYSQSTKELKNDKDFNTLQKYLVLSLYSLHAPRRLEYADTRVITNDEYQKLSDEDLKNNIYLVVVSRNKKFFSFGKLAVKSETSDNQKINLDKGLNSVLNLFLNVTQNSSDYLLKDSKGNKMTKNGLSKFLSKLFSPKKISASMLRKIFLSHEFKPENTKKAVLAEKMNHSVKTQQQVYVKED